MNNKRSTLVLSEGGDRLLKKAALLVAFLPPLADSLVIYPLTQIALANLGTGVLYQLLTVLSQLVSISGFFVAVAIAVYCVFADAFSALGRVFALQGISYLVSVVLLRTLIQWLLALIDSTFVFPFAFSNFTLNTITENDGMMLVWSAISLFVNVILLMVLMTVIVGIALLLRRRARDSVTLETLAESKQENHPSVTLCLRIATVIYLVQALINQIYTTVTSVSGVSTDELIGELASIVSPYFLLAIYTFVGYWAMQSTIRALAAKVLDRSRNV